MSTISKLLALAPPTPVLAIEGPQRGFLQQAPKAVDPQLLFGVELEIENIPNWDNFEFHGMTSTHDGSLRNNGREFLMQPAEFGDAFATLSHFFDQAKLSDRNYSDRTSIHVHTNCQDLKIDELQSILFLYQATESLLFNWVNPERADNIFCVPWSQTNLSFQIFDGKRDIRKFRNWAKYTALNLLPLYTYGTIEWRHMHGHCNVNKLIQWLQIISCFYRYARKVKIDELKETLINLNTTSHYGMFVDMVFQEHGNFIYQQPNWQQQLEENILMLKYAVTSEVKAVKGRAANLAVIDDYAMGVQNMADELELAVDPQPQEAPPANRQFRVRFENPAGEVPLRDNTAAAAQREAIANLWLAERRIRENEQRRRVAEALNRTNPQ